MEIMRVFRDRLYVDVRAQMGRIASENLSQITLFLITSLAMQQAEAELNQHAAAW